MRQGCRLINQCQNLAPGHRGVGCLSGVPTYLPGTVGQACRLFKHCQNLPPWHCLAVVQAVKVELEPTFRALWGSGAGCLIIDGADIQGTVGQGCRLFKQCRNLIPGHCGAGLLSFKAVSEPTSRSLCGRGAGCLRGLRTFLPGTVGQRCRLFKLCQNLSPGHCEAGVQAVLEVSEPTSRALLGIGAGCLSSIRTYLVGTLGKGCRLF